MTRPPALALAAALAFAASACNAPGAKPLPTATPVPVAPTATVLPQPPAITTPTDLRGTWTADVEGTTASSGIWTLEISTSNLTLHNPVGGDPFTLDPTAMSETTLVLPAASDCPDQSSVTMGTYTIAVTGDLLRFTLVRDSCGDRSGVLVTGTWKRKS